MTALKPYLQEIETINFSHPAIRERVAQLFTDEQTEVEKIRIAFEFVRDDIAHSWDIQHEVVTCVASDVLLQQHGICYAKSNLLAALLRSQSIPVGFCYQRLMLFDTPEKGYCIHALNAVYVRSVGRWIRLDARGNKPGVDAQFSLDKEQLAFTVNEQMGEIDYETIYDSPHVSTIDVLKNSTNALHMYMHDLPQSI